MDNPKLTLRKKEKFGKAIFAGEDILKGELIAEFDGQIYDFNYENWNRELADHVIQFERKKWRDSNGMARFLNHSCEPNCGVKDLFKIVAMRDINKGEEITWDYEMTEDNEK